VVLRGPADGSARQNWERSARLVAPSLCVWEGGGNRQGEGREEGGENARTRVRGPAAAEGAAMESALTGGEVSGLGSAGSRAVALPAVFLSMII
jgi:hypothetical protein